MNGTDPAVLLSSPVRRRILEVLDAAEAGEDEDTATRLGAEGLTAAQLANRLSLHVTTVRFHLDQLVAAGLVSATFHKHVGAGRPRKVYARVLTPEREVPAHDSFVLLSRLLTEAFSAQTESQEVLTPDEAGRRWAIEHVPVRSEGAASTPGQWIAKLGRVVDVLSAWGYDPELTADGAGRDARIELTHCPFRELALQNPDVVCGIHRGLIAGTLDRLGEADSDVDLVPFADGHRCIARIRSNAPVHVPPPTTVPSSVQRSSARPSAGPHPTPQHDTSKETR
jgi:predicted ArsR family transcriptional regulator